MPVAYDDWTVTAKHRDVVRTLLPAGLRDIELTRDIPGIVGRRITEDFRAGVYIQPVVHDVVQKFSITQDVRHISLLVAGEGKSSLREASTPKVMTLANAIRNAFADKRVTGYDCELFSSNELMSYEIDANVARRYDVVIIQLSSTLREDR